MGRRRKAENAGYPKGVYASKGWLFWDDPAGDGTWVKLCRVEEWGTEEGRRRWAKISTTPSTRGTIGALLDAHLAHRLALLRQGTGDISSRTYTDNCEYTTHLKKVFGAMLPHQVTSKHIAGYLQKRAWQPRPKKGANGELVVQPPRLAPVRANKEISWLSTTYAWAIASPDWPMVTSNPCLGVTRNKERSSTRCPERWEIDEAKKHAPEQWVWILDLLYMIGQRGIDTRLLPRKNLRPDGILVGTTKTGAEIVIEWNDDLYGTVLALLAHGDAIAAARHVTTPYVITARSGGPYTAQGWKSIVYKLVHAAIADPDNALEQPFSTHNIRARSATDEEELLGTNPQHRLGHTKRSTTEIYLRGKRRKRVKALKLAS